MGLFDSAIGMIAPPQCMGCETEGAILCEACLTSEIMPFGERCWRCHAISQFSKTCPSCRGFRGPLHVWISSEYIGIIKALVRSYKFGHFRPASKIIVQEMARTLLMHNSDATLDKRSYLIVPIPTATGRARERGFDHTRLLARSLARQLKLDVYEGLYRTDQARQIGATRDQRLKQPVGKYRLATDKKIKNRSVLLIDDVVTTGGTLREATKILRKAGARRVDALVFTKKL